MNTTGDVVRIALLVYVDGAYILVKIWLVRKVSGKEATPDQCNVFEGHNIEMKPGK